MQKLRSAVWNSALATLLFGAVIYGLREIPETIFRPKEQQMFDVASREESLAIEAFTYAYMTTVKEKF